jgi:TRAP-type C4-dicarboxylate transport system substrate-binding protein
MGASAWHLGQGALMLFTASSIVGKNALASAYPADNFHTQNLAAFANDVAQVTDGRLAIRIYPNASLLPASAGLNACVHFGSGVHSITDINAPRRHSHFVPGADICSAEKIQPIR